MSAAAMAAARTAELIRAAEGGDLLLRAGRVLHRSRTAPHASRTDLRATAADHLHATTEDAQIVHQLITEGRLTWRPDGLIRVPTTTSQESS